MPDAAGSESAEPAVLATFEPSLARAVSDILTEHGIPCEQQRRGDEHDVLVPAGRREEAFAVLSHQMEQVQRRTHTSVLDHHATATDDPTASEGQEHDERPMLVTERFRRMGFVAIALVPLLVVTLSNVRIPGGMTIALIIGATVALAAMRNGRRRSDDADGP